MEWFDSRLKFRNLKPKLKQNLVADAEAEQLWIPELYFLNTDHNLIITNDKKANIRVDRRGTATPNDLSWVNQIILYEGSENPLIYTRDFTVDFHCHYHLQAFPFDTQVKIIINICCILETTA